MRLFRWALTAILFVILGAAIYQTALWLGGWGNTNDSNVKPLEGSDQEIAFIEPATGIDDWGRLVTALQLMEMDWPKINPGLPAVKLSLDDAFPPLTADVPEVVFSFTNNPAQKLRLRWYKISGEHDAGSWVRKLRERPRQPLAIVGGGTSERAVKLARRLQETYPDAEEASPVLLITTATAEKTKKGNSLIDVYKGRTFRFSFTNQKMVDALLKFVEHRHYPDAEKAWAQNLWVYKNADAPPPVDAMHAVTWLDERYSQDMTELFEQKFLERNPQGKFFHEGPISFGVGGFYHPSQQEQYAVGIFLARPGGVAPHSILVLPTQTVRMRRFLINLRQRSPLDARNLVVLNGDAISFHSVYRDRDVTWNILDLPYSLVFFAHRNPIDPAAGFTWTKDDRPESNQTFPHRSTSGTHDVLLYRDVFEALLYAVGDGGNLLDDPHQVRRRLQSTCWYHPPPEKIGQENARVCNAEVHSFANRQPLFDADGNRQSHTGEHIVWVKPNFTDERVDMTSKISVWFVQPPASGGSWQLLDSHDALYNQSP